jgi:hypothetical protein
MGLMGESSRAASTGTIVTITSGKGGVGKTTSAASFAFGLAEAGHKTCVIDFDIGLRNLDIHLVRVDLQMDLCWLVIADLALLLSRNTGLRAQGDLRLCACDPARVYIKPGSNALNLAVCARHGSFLVHFRVTGADQGQAQPEPVSVGGVPDEG